MSDSVSQQGSKRHLVLGSGEVGSAIQEIFSSQYEVEVCDKEQTVDGSFEVLHVCFPFSDTFVSCVNAYVDQYASSDALVIIHSTVPLGTTKMCMSAVHSPIRGVHPELVKGVQTFVKYIGGERAQEAAEIFHTVGIKTHTTLRSENTEALKLWDTTYYGWCILFEKAVHAYCQRHTLDWDLVYTEANKSYNEGYKALGMSHVIRPVLKHVDGAIGGHCVLQNLEILDDEMTQELISLNERLK
jgi:hypothetical protein